MRATAMTALCGVLATAVVTAAAPGAVAQSVPLAPAVGGMAYVDTEELQPTVPGAVARIVDGLAYAPADAPPAVQQLIWAANDLIGLPYRYGGGHRSFTRDTGYDCSGSVSYALHAGDLLDSPLDSGSLMTWGDRGAGTWITVLTNPDHAFLHVAGIRLDTSTAEDRSGLRGPRWRPLRKVTRGFRARHPPGL